MSSTLPHASGATQPGARDIEGLGDIVTKLGGRPIDVWAVAALLESAGVRDRDAIEHHQLPDVFALARQVFDRLRADESARAPRTRREPVVEPQDRRLTRRASAAAWARGGFFFVPMGVQVVALVAIGYSQYASVHFRTDQASIVALAVGLAFVATGGFVQGLGFLGPQFEEPGKHMLTQRVVYLVMLAALIAMTLFAACAYGVNAVVGAYSTHQAQILAVYFMLVAGQAVTNAALYMLRRFVALGLSTIAAVGVVAALTQLTSISITHVHWIALASWWLFQLAWLALVLRRRASRTAGSMRLARLPRAAFLTRRAAPYAAYGSLYFLLLFTDRLVAWSAGSHPLPFWFSTRYELGLDAALIAAVVSIAFLEVTVERFTRLLGPVGDRYPISDVDAHNAFLIDFRRRQLRLVVGLLAVGGAGTFGTAELLRALHALGRLDSQLHDDATLWAFGGGFVGYSLLTVGLANSALLLSLSRPGGVVRAVGLAALVSAGVGLTITSFEPFYTAVLGLVAGSVVYAWLSGIEARRSLRHADYSIYAAW